MSITSFQPLDTRGTSDICSLVLKDSPVASRVSKLNQDTLEASAPVTPGFTSLPDGATSRIRLDRAGSNSRFHLTPYGLLPQEKQKLTPDLLKTVQRLHLKSFIS